LSFLYKKTYFKPKSSPQNKLFRKRLELNLRISTGNYNFKRLNQQKSYQIKIVLNIYCFKQSLTRKKCEKKTIKLLQSITIYNKDAISNIYYDNMVY